MSILIPNRKLFTPSRHDILGRFSSPIHLTLRSTASRQCVNTCSNQNILIRRRIFDHEPWFRILNEILPQNKSTTNCYNHPRSAVSSSNRSNHIILLGDMISMLSKYTYRSSCGACRLLFEENIHIYVCMYIYMHLYGNPLHVVFIIWNIFE